MFLKIILVFRVIKNLKTFVLDFFGFINDKETIYETRSGLKFFTRTGTSDKSEVVIICGDSEYPKRYFPKENNPVIIDIGSHIGSFSGYIQRMLQGNNPVVYSIEPAPNNFHYLVENMRLNSFETENCFNVAVGDRNGAGYIDSTKDNDAFTVGGEERLKTPYADKMIKCEMVTLEKFCDDRHIKTVDLLKIDCEGGEYDIFNHSLEFIKKNVKSVFAEVHYISKEKNIGEFKEFAEKNNFRVEAEILGRTLFLRNLNL